MLVSLDEAMENSMKAERSGDRAELHHAEELHGVLLRLLRLLLELSSAWQELFFRACSPQPERYQYHLALCADKTALIERLQESPLTSVAEFGIPVKAPAFELGSTFRPWEVPTKEHRDRLLRYRKCEGCGKSESVRKEFKRCSGCTEVVYCGRLCREWWCTQCHTRPSL